MSDSRSVYAQLESGSNFAEYKLDEYLGKGTFGKVYSAVNLTNSNRCAVKIFRDSFTDQPGFSARFDRVFQMLKDLHHINITQIHDFGISDRLHWCSMDLAPGDGEGSLSLQNLINYHKELDVSVVIGILTGVLQALAEAHKSSFVHSNLKPSNILLYRLPDGRKVARVSDFSQISLVDFNVYLGRLRKAVKNSLRNLIPADERGDSYRSLLISKEYMAPELEHSGKADYRSDVYSLGLIFYRLLCGVKLSARPPSYHNSLLGPGHDRFIMKALEADPSDRYSDAEEMLAAIEPLQDLINREVEQKRREKVSIEVKGIRKKAADLVSEGLYEQALEVLWEVMEQYPGRQDILDDYSTVEEQVHERRVLANQEEQYNLDSKEACDLESAGNLEDALRVWMILAELFPDKTRASQEVKRLMELIGQAGDGETADDLENANQAAVLRERIIKYRCLRNQAWDYAENGKFKDALAIIAQLKKDYPDREELISELEMIEEETTEAMNQEKIKLRRKLVKWILISCFFLSIIGSIIWFILPLL